jgi:hypothetical protein
MSRYSIGGRWSERTSGAYRTSPPVSGRSKRLPVVVLSVSTRCANVLTSPTASPLPAAATFGLVTVFVRTVNRANVPSHGVGVEVTVGSGVLVAVAVGVAVSVGVSVAVAVGVCVGVSDGVAVGVSVGVAVAVSVGVAVGVAVGVGA